MIKNVRVTVMGPIPIVTSVGSLTHGTHGPMLLDEKDLFKCIASGATVNEVITPGVQIRLDFNNYQTDNAIFKGKAPSIPKPVDASSINNGPIIKNNPVRLDRSLPMVDALNSISDEIVTSGYIEPVEEAAEEEVDTKPLNNESPKHWQAPPKEKRNRKH